MTQGITEVRLAADGQCAIVVVEERTSGCTFPAPFEYERATSVEPALELLQQLGPEARLPAGGHSLLPMMTLRLATPGDLIDIDALADELGYIRAAAPAAETDNRTIGRGRFVTCLS